MVEAEGDDAALCKQLENLVQCLPSYLFGPKRRERAEVENQAKKTEGGGGNDRLHSTEGAKKEGHPGGNSSSLLLKTEERAGSNSQNKKIHKASKDLKIGGASVGGLSPRIGKLSRKKQRRKNRKKRRKNRRTEIKGKS